MVNFSQNLVIFGFMGSGKTVVGRVLSSYLNRVFIDTDEIISSSLNCETDRIFSKYKESGFRVLERVLLKKTSRINGIIVAAGGGSILNKDIFFIFRNSVFICLNFNFFSLKKRTRSNLSARPILLNGGHLDGLHLFNERAKKYGKIFHQIDTESKHVFWVALEIIDRLKIDAFLSRGRLLVSNHEDRKIYPVFVAKKSFSYIGFFLRWINYISGRVIVITDSTARRLYCDFLIKILKVAGYHAEICEIRAAGDVKNLSNVKFVMDFLLKNKVNNCDLLLSLGGGAIADISGFVASIYLRGISVLHVPTTVLAMIDAGFGEKTGVDLAYGKNLAGSIYAPVGVVIDYNLSLSQDFNAIKAGLVETIKYSILSKSFFKKIKSRFFVNVDSFLYHSLLIKSLFIKNDIFGKNIRHFLNLGHTLAHSIEKASEYRASHGNAVSLGLVFSLEMSFLFNESSCVLLVSIKNTLRVLGLPYFARGLNVSEIYNYMNYDKKKANKKLCFVISVKVGKIGMICGLSELVLKKTIADIALN